MLTKRIGREFVEKTQRRFREESDQRKGLPPPPIELGYDKSKTIIDLPASIDIKVDAVGLREAIESRMSLRDYSEQPLTMEELSWLLWCTQGVKEFSTFTRAGLSTRVTKRNVPSGGARHPFETYILVNKVVGLRPGLYRYLALKHKLVEVDLEVRVEDKKVEACLPQHFVKTSAVIFIWTVVVYRETWRYGERGYRSMYIESGHICQNLYLSAEAIKGGVCAIGAFRDENINSLIGIDGKEQFVIYVATVGKRK